MILFINSEFTEINIQKKMTYLMTNLIVYFISTPSVYTLSGTWEKQPLVPVEMVFSTAVAIATLGVVLGLIATMSIIKIRRKKV